MNNQQPFRVIVSANVTAQGLRIKWQDQHESLFHWIWLRHQCTCPACGTPMDAIRGIFIHQIPESVSGNLLSISERHVEIEWCNDKHLSTYQADWLRQHCYTKSEHIKRQPRPILWDSSIIKNPPVADFNQAEGDPHYRLHTLEMLDQYGFCKIINTPRQRESAERPINLVGPQRASNFGSYILSQKKSADNVGDTSSALLPHTDETYRISAIGITVFQVFHAASNGGATTLVDGFEAVRRLKATDEDAFHLLVTTPIATQRTDQATTTDRQPSWYQSRMPMIKLDGDGEVSGIRMNERQIGPLDVPSDLVLPVYSALRKLFTLLYSDDLVITFPLQPGEGMLFNNQRVLHGRTAFQPEHPARSVLTSSVDLDEFHSSLRMLRAALNQDTAQRYYSQGLAT